MNTLPRLFKRLMGDTRLSALLEKQPLLEKKALGFLSHWLVSTLNSSPRKSDWKMRTDILQTLKRGPPNWSEMKELSPSHDWELMEKLYPQLLPQEQKALLSQVHNLWETRVTTDLYTQQSRYVLPKLPQLKSNLLENLGRIKVAQDAVTELFGESDVGWDLESGSWKDTDIELLRSTAKLVARNRELLRIAEILGRDYRSRFRKNDPPPPTPPPKTPPVPHIGKEEIFGVRWGTDWGDLLSQEIALTAFPETQTVFYKKAAEGELLNWNYQAPEPPPRYKKKQELNQTASLNDRGPVIICLDTSGSMRGKPELVAKQITFALLQIALREKRPCFLINFSADIQTLEISNLRDNLDKLTDFLRFSFHGGTDLPKPLRYTLSLMSQKTWSEADVLIVSDFAVPKIPSDLRALIRKQQDSRDNRFYCLTISARPLNDWLNLFDGGWVYNVNPQRPEGIDPLEVYNLS